MRIEIEQLCETSNKTDDISGLWTPYTTSLKSMFLTRGTVLDLTCYILSELGEQPYPSPVRENIQCFSQTFYYVPDVKANAHITLTVYYSAVRRTQ